MTKNNKKLIKGCENIALSQKEREKLIIKAEKHFGKFLTSLGFDWENDPNMSETPHRVTKAYVEEILAGNFHPMPKITAFEDSDKETIYDGIICQTDIEIKSVCSHHFLSFDGVCHIAYLPDEEKGTLIGLSKLNRIADFYARRPQVQERLTRQIHDAIDAEIPNNRGVAVMLECKHTCCSHRGIGHKSTMKTTYVSKMFREDASVKDEFLFAIQRQNNIR